MISGCRYFHTFIRVCIISIALATGLKEFIVQKPDDISVTKIAPALDKPLALKYWNGRGLMEVGRMILAIAGKFPVMPNSIIMSTK